MKDFNSYSRSDDNQGKKGDSKKVSSDPMDLFKNLSAKYEGKSADDVMSQIILEAERGRRNGTLSDKDIDNFASKVTPLLNEKQRKMLSAIVLRLKNIK